VEKAVERVQVEGAGPGIRSPKRVGRQLRHVRRKQGLSRAEVARSAGLTRRELAAYERGRVEIPDSDLWCLAGSCGVDVGELLPQRDELRIDSDLSSLAIGDSIRHLREPAEPDALLREYLAMIYELRNLPPGSAIPLRESDLSTLADALGGSPEAIESRLVELIGVNRDEAVRLRAMILPPLALDAGDIHSLPPFDSAVPDSYSDAIHTEPTPQLDAFLDAPRAEDPFSDPPPLMPSEPPMSILDAAPSTAPADTWSPAPIEVPQVDTPAADAFPVLRPDPFARPAGPSEASEPAPRLLAPDHDGIVVDLPDPLGHLPAEDLSPIIPESDLWAAREPMRSLPDLSSLPVVEPSASLEMDRVEHVVVDRVPDVVETEPMQPIVWHASSVVAVDPSVETVEPSIRLTHAGSGWQVGGMFPATAMADDGALSLQRADTRWALSDLSAAGDVTAEAIVDFTAGPGFGILFRAGLDSAGALYGYSFDIDAVAGGGGYVLRQWDANRPHWRPLAHAQVLDPTRLLGRRTIAVSVRGDSLTVDVDGESVLTVPSLSHASIELGRQPCRGDRLGIQAAATTEVTVSRLSAAQH
jgi:transcriptional regulator with XRE-family HTH domain